MPLVDPNAVERINLTTEGETIDVSKGLSVKNFRKALKAVSGYSGDGPENTPLYLEVVKSWTVKGLDGEIAPISEETISQLCVQDELILEKAVMALYLPKA